MFNPKSELSFYLKCCRTCVSLIFLFEKDFYSCLTHPLTTTTAKGFIRNQKYPFPAEDIHKYRIEALRFNIWQYKINDISNT